MVQQRTGAAASQLDVDDIVVGNHNKHSMNSESKSARSNYAAENEDEYEDQGGGGDVDDDDSRPIKPKQQMAYNDFDPEVDNNAFENEHQDSFADGEHPLDGAPGYVELPTPEELVSKARYYKSLVCCNKHKQT